MDDLNSSSICAVLDSGIYIVIWDSIEKISTAATHFWIGNGKRVFVPWCIPVQPAWAALMLLCKMLFLCEASGSLRVLREKPEAGLIKRGFFSLRKNLILLGQWWIKGISCEKNTWGSYFILLQDGDPLTPFPGIPSSHSRCQVTWCVNSRRNQVAAEGQWGP